MSDKGTRSIPWLLIAGGGVAAIGAILLVLGMSASSGAKFDHESAESAVSRQESVVASAEETLTDAEADLADNLVQAADAASDRAERESDRAETLASLEALRGDIQLYVLAAGGATADAGLLSPPLSDLAAQHREQIAAILAEDYGAFNALRAIYAESAGLVADGIEGLAGRYSDLPEVPISDPYDYVGPALHSDPAATEPQDLDPPTGPAEITVEAPDEIECDPWGNQGCSYEWTVTFVESNWMEFTITRIGVRYRRGNTSCATGRGETFAENEWLDTDLTVHADGTFSWGNNIQIDRDDVCRYSMGGELQFRWKGTDAEGNRLSGRVDVPLQNPS